MEIKYNHTKTRWIVIESRAGSTYIDSISEAIVLCCSNRVNVILEHNGSHYSIDYEDAVKSLPKNFVDIKEHSSNTKKKV